MRPGLRSGRDQARSEARAIATKSAHTRMLRFRDQFPSLSADALIAFEADCKRSYMAGYTRAANDHRSWIR